jgi:hypothetical protein
MQKQFEMPAWAGQLPSRIGSPAGGSLSADEYKVLITYVSPMIVRPNFLFSAIVLLICRSASQGMGYLV